MKHRSEPFVGPAEYQSLLPKLAIVAAMLFLAAAADRPARGQPMLFKTETFDVDPGWDGHNNRAVDPGPTADRSEFRVRRFDQQCGRTGRRNRRVHHPGGRAGLLWKGHCGKNA